MKRMTVTITMDGAEPVVLENIKGMIGLMREDDGVRKCILGKLTILDAAMMIKALTTGNGPENERLKRAAKLAAVMEDFRDEEMMDVTPAADGVNDPFTDLIRSEGRDSE